ARMISIIICTYGRSTAVEDLFSTLAVQTNQDFEVLVIDANSAPSPIRTLVDRFSERLPVRWIGAPKGLTRQRNIGLRESCGDLICFLDDDVTVDADFLARVNELFARADLKDVGGLTGYDVLNYAAVPNLRWKLKWWLRAIPSLKPGDA